LVAAYLNLSPPIRMLCFTIQITATIPCFIFYTFNVAKRILELLRMDDQ
jgi:hypothetical protein